MFELAYGHYYLPAADDALQNKYAMPAYRHLKARGDYTLHGHLNELQISLLYIYKGQLGNTPLPYTQIFNKVNMHSINLMLHYSF